MNLGAWSGCIDYEYMNYKKQKEASKKPLWWADFPIVYSRDPIKTTARLTVFEIFSLGSLLIEPARLTILTISSTLIANQLSKYEYFLSKLTDFALI